MCAEQAPTSGTSPERIMKSREFSAGVADVRLGRAPRFDDPIARDWNYERGRMFALIAPMKMPTKIGKELNPKAVLIFSRAMFAGEIL
jgi:hypothetical protein